MNSNVEILDDIDKVTIAARNDFNTILSKRTRKLIENSIDLKITDWNDLKAVL